ncbi:MAG: hypothetical protein Tsb0021_12200 [Chlamydiales bacterium]
MKNYNLVKLALMGLASGLIFSGQASAEETEDIIRRNEGTELARGGCGAGCGGGGGNTYQSSMRDRRYRNGTQRPMYQDEDNYNEYEDNGREKPMYQQDSQHGSCGGSGCGGGNGNGQHGGSNGNMKNKRNNSMQRY